MAEQTGASDHLSGRSADAERMNSATRPVLSLPRPADLPAALEQHGLWFYYRNARMWGKPIIWSIRYAREATLKFN
jgi:hypothetical protein